MTTPSREAALRGRRRRTLARKLTARFDAGETVIGDLATAIGRKPSLVRRLLEEAGVHTEHSPYIGADDDQLATCLAARHHQHGDSITALIHDTSLHRARLHALLHHAEQPPRRAKAATPPPPGTGQQYLHGASLRELERRTGIDYSTLATKLRAAGVPLRPPGRSPTKPDL
ncbi:hypothetical protein GCM10027271_42810 [Saccharopolyspora gloriosae]|uniref:Lambda repressor-like predicted transcriptional regulator n=1 Tax=Saccharopolyspora gloriosae TaxID=455344 RepID=A0A840NJU0_9PSEU|nr:hypothetical protein [Saccharopolyspora gloriosae]MBB5070423.1 lambda repressor-like predicted transcriptional regulator [Saccharopolyspora gloriosae]